MYGENWSRPIHLESDSVPLKINGSRSIARFLHGPLKAISPYGCIFCSGHSAQWNILTLNEIHVLCQYRTFPFAVLQYVYRTGCSVRFSCAEKVPSDKQLLVNMYVSMLMEFRCQITLSVLILTKSTMLQCIYIYIMLRTNSSNMWHCLFSMAKYLALIRTYSAVTNNMD